jgi:uncharacterized membrane protein
MQTSPPQSRRLRDYSSIPLEILVVTFSLLPFLVLAYFYPALPDRVPLFLNLSGEVESWTQKSLLSVFRVPLIAVVMQVVCLLMKYGVVQSQATVPASIDVGEFLSLNAGLWDWFRWTIALKMIAESLDTIFLSLDRFKFLSRPAFIISIIATALGAIGALFYGYRLLAVMREMKRKFKGAKLMGAVDARHVYGGVFYFNPSDPALFAGRYVFNFGNKWTWVFIACIVAYPWLAFWSA